jgi:hypothetical protein
MDPPLQKGKLALRDVTHLPWGVLAPKSHDFRHSVKPVLRIFSSVFTYRLQTVGPRIRIIFREAGIASPATLMVQRDSEWA